MENEQDIVRVISDRFFPLPPKELAKLASIIEYRELKKGDLFLDEGQIAKYISFVQSGMLRQFYYKNGRDITEHFTCDGSIAFCIISMFRSEPTNLMIEALEPTVLYNIPYERLIALSTRYPTIANLHRKILEWALMLSQEKADSWRFETAKERYLRFTKDFPEAAKRASVNHIASYLLMTPESLSRVRSGSL